MYQLEEFQHYTLFCQNIHTSLSPLQVHLMTLKDSIGRTQKDHEQHPMPLENRN